MCKFTLFLKEASPMGAVIFPKEAFHCVDSSRQISVASLLL